jgi:hypothetical protein
VLAHRHRRFALLGALALLGTAAAPASAQEPCVAPEITAFTIPPEQIRADEDTYIVVRVSGAARVEVTWPQRDVSIAPAESFGAGFHRVFRRPGPFVLSAVAVAPCGARSGVARLRGRVYAPCAEARDRSIRAYDCADEADPLIVRAGGLATRGNLLSPAECRDVPPMPRDVPVARAASCAAPPPGPPLVEGSVPIRPGGDLELHLGAPARGLVVRLGDVRGPRIRVRGIRRRSATFRREWVVPLPRSLAGITRIYVTALRPGANYRWVAGVSA